MNHRPHRPGTREAHVWTSRVPGHIDADGSREARWLPLLSVDERRRMDLFHHAADRELYAAAHGLLRTALSWCVPEIAPGDWKFHADPQGRPELAHEMRGTGLRFNLSHTRGLAACVVTRGPDCGIDVEPIDRRSADGRLERAVLAPSEMAALSKLPQPSRAAGFIRYWTLKEAYAKAIGLGLSVPFDQCGFSFAGGPEGGTPDTDTQTDTDTAHITQDNDYARRWQFRQWRPGPAHLLALALRRGAGADLTVVDHGVDADLPPGHSH